MFVKISEQPSLYNDLEKKSVREILEDINTEDQKVALAVQKAIPQIEKLVNLIVPRMKQGGRIFYMGAGTSGRLGVLDASEIPPTFGMPPTLVIGLIAGGDTALRNPVENAEDDTHRGWEELTERNITDRDTVIGIAASGTTPYVIGAMHEAREHGILTGCITSNPDSPMAAEADVAIEMIVGPEYVTGSSRMKSGTGQKMILNMITTSVMIQLGRVKGNKMVNMQLSNKKLVDRGTRMLVEELGLDYGKAKALLLMHGSVKKAVDAYMTPSTSTKSNVKTSLPTGNGLREGVLLLFLFLLQTVFGQPLQRIAPEQAGMDSRKLVYADEAIETAIANREIPGAVLAVVRGGKMGYLKAYGNKRIYPDTQPMTTNTIFDMASCSKSMSTAVCVMILAERGKIRMLDPVSLYIPGFKNWESEDGKEKKVIRIADLMTHTSGLPPYASVAELEKRYGSPDPAGLMEYIATCKRDFKPQTDFQYSCLNFITLQHIIENVSGKSLRDFARENIFDVLGMNHTDYLPCRRDKNGQWTNTDLPHWAQTTNNRTTHSSLSTNRYALSDVAPTEKQADGQVLCGQVHDPLARIMNGGISGNAGVFSCAEDIAVLCAALQNGGEWNGHRILSPLGVKTMRTVPRATAAFGRTLGWDNFSAYASNNGDLFGPNTYGHTGYTGTSIIIDPDNDTSVILLINAVHPEDGHSTVRLRSLVANAVAAAICPIPRTYTEHYYKRFLQFTDEPAITRKDIVMLGNSLTENGGDWSARLGKEGIRNRGIIGDEIMGIYDRLHQILPGHPAKLFLLTGVNDVSHDLTTDSIVAIMRTTIERIQRESPETKLYLQSLLPINESFGRYKRLNGKTDMIPEINARLEALAKEKKITFINLFPLFTEKGTNVLRSELTNDGLHLKEEGYKIWVKAIRKKI